VFGVPPAPSAPSPLELGGAEPGPLSSDRDELDPELLALPDPPKRERTLTLVVLSLAGLLSLAMVFALRRDVAYALGSATPVDLGDLHAATAASLGAAENHFVRADALLGAVGGIRYERPFVEDTFRALPVAVRVPAGQETGRWEPPRTLAGRLVRFDAAGPRHRGIANAIARTTHADVPAGAWLLVDGEAPDGARWTVLLAVAFLGCAAWNLVAMARIVRRVR
jgi:hypothetical protein